MRLKIIRIAGPMDSGRSSIASLWHRNLSDNGQRSHLITEQLRGHSVPVPEGTLTVVYDPPCGAEDYEIESIAASLQLQGVLYLIVTKYPCDTLALAA